MNIGLKPGAVVRPNCEQIIDTLVEPLVVIDRDFRIVAANRAYCRHYGVDKDQVVGRHCYQVSHGCDAPCSQHGEQCPKEHVFATRRATQVMHIHVGPDGGDEYVQLNASPVFDEQGEVLYMVEYVHPVSRPGESDAILVGRSRRMLRLMSLLQRVAPSDTTVLLLGESGVGKERVAEYIHQYSERVNGPFVVVDCGVLGEQLIESELFGHEKGAFTGATRRREGLFETARGGTLFIDEVGDLPLPLQTKLLRVLETGTIRRLGGSRYLDVDVRVIAATNRDLSAMVRVGRFRQDLYYRLSAFPVNVPPLREHKGDIPVLAEHFLRQMPGGERFLPLLPETIEALLGSDYPGNVRQLRNVVERATILAEQDTILPEHLVFEEAAGGEAEAPVPPPSGRRRLTPDAVQAALEQCDGHRGRAARLLGVSERTIYRHVRRLRGGDAHAGGRMGA